MATFSIIVETENLGMAGLDDLEASLNSLLAQSLPINKIDEVIVIAGSHVSNELLKNLRLKYKWLTVKTVEGSLNYLESKMKGAELSKSDYLVFADSDMRYEKTWLSGMVSTFKKHPDGYVLSGDTRLQNNSIYKMSLNLTWMVQILSDKITTPEPTTFFPLNNFAIKRQDLIQNPIPTNLPLYRNVIPFWERMLTNGDLKVLRVPGTRGYHAPPGSFSDWWYRMLAYGSDFVAMSDFTVENNNKIIESNSLLKRLFRYCILLPWKIKQIIFNSLKIAGEDYKNLTKLPFAFILGILNIVVIQIGATIGLFNRTYVFRQITERETSHVV